MKNLAPKTILFLAAVAAAFVPPAFAEGKKTIAVSIKPLYSLARAVVGGAGRVELVQKRGDSPHGFSLRPSQMALLQEADVAIYISPHFESYMPKALRSVDVRAISMEDAPGLLLLPLRKGMAADKDDHDDHDDHGHDEHDHDKHADHDDHEKHDDHADHDDHDSHGHDDHKKRDDHDDHADHHHEGGQDLHFWLDVGNAQVMARYIAAQLGDEFPQHAAAYRQNADRLVARLQKLEAELKADLLPLKGRRYVAFHDAFQYLERRYGLRFVGSIRPPDASPSSARRLLRLRERLAEGGDGDFCILREPQFVFRHANTLPKGAGVAQIDPIGADLPDNEDLYFELMRANGKNLLACYKQ